MPYSNRSSYFVLAMCAAAAAIAIWSVQFAPKEQPQPPSADEAVTACQNSIKPTLRSPSTTRWIESDSWAALDAATNTWKARVDVDTSNVFGAIERQHYTCTLQHADGHTWNVLSLTR